MGINDSVGILRPRNVGERRKERVKRKKEKKVKGRVRQRKKKNNVKNKCIHSPCMVIELGHLQ